MGKYSNALLNDNLGGSPVKSYSKELLSGNIQREFTPTTEIDTRTGKPRVEFTPTGQPTTGFGTLIKSGVVDDPQTKINIFAKARGISPDRYGIVDGEIVYRGDDGKLYPETKKTFSGKIKRFAGETIGHTPGIVGGTIGAATGPGTSALLAAGGEGIRMSVGSLAFGEPQTATGNILGMGTEAAISAGGTFAGGKITQAIDATKGRQGARLLRAAGRGAERIKTEEVAAITKLAQKHGISINTPQATGSQELIARFSLLGDLPVTADKIGRNRLKQYAQINDSVQKWLGTFGGETVTPGTAGRRAVEASKDAIKSALDLRKNRAKPFYDKAFATATEVDIKPVVELIEGKLKTAKGPIRKELLRAKSILQRPDLPKVEKSLLVDATGKPLAPKVTFDTSLEGLHSAKVAIGDIIDKARQTSLGNMAKRNYTKIQKLLLSQMDDASKDYKKARNIFSEESLIPEELGKTKIASLSKLEGDNAEKAAKMVLSPGSSSPEIVDITKQAIIDQGGQGAWDNLIRVHLKKSFRDVVKTGTKNIGGMLRKKVFGDIEQREILRVAMTKTQFKNYTDLMLVLERTGLTAGKESATAPRLVSLAKMTSEAEGVMGKLVRAATRPLYTYQRIGGDFIASLRSEAYQERLADAMLSKTAAKQLQGMLRLKPGSRKLIQQAAAFLTLTSVGSLQRTGKRKFFQPTLRPPK